MPLEKIPGILLVGLENHISLTSPTSRTPKKERRMEDGVVSVDWRVRIFKGGYWVHAIIELCLILGARGTWPKRLRVVALFLPNGTHPECIGLTPTTAFATILVVLGGSLRYWCIREMGKQFTFHVTLVKDHKLITTGPYNIVRHPAYTGLILVIIWNLIWYTARGSWLRESMASQMVLPWLLISPVMYITIEALVSMACRMPVEDAILKEEFGKEWDEWAKRVPCRLLPGIL